MLTRNLWLFTVTFILNIILSSQAQWGYECNAGSCEKRRLTAEMQESAISLHTCRLLCSKYASIWPKPTGTIEFAPTFAQLNINSIDVLIDGSDLPIKPLIDGATKRFKNNLDLLGPATGRKAGGKSLVIQLQIADVQLTKAKFELNEKYALNVTQTIDGRIQAVIKAENFFGARHGLETLSQVIVFDDLRNEYQMLNSLYITDEPIYHYRGILLDTSRNFVSIETIKRTIEGMAASKLNVFHWHITDSQSFPYESKSEPKLTELGAYSLRKIYTAADVADLIEFATIRGVKVLPEFDAPAHVGEGWQDTGFLACFNKKPWQKYCVEPPCGQLDPTQDAMYDVVENIYKDMIAQFDPDIFHMGGDEVNEKCWESEKRIVDWMTARNISIDESGFLKLWDHFQKKALERFEKQRGSKIPIVLWTSKLTSAKYIHYLSPNDYIIQIWTTGSDEQIKLLLRNGFRTILSNYDALYFDCGFSNWVGEGNNWCSPFIGWKKVYENSPTKIAGMHKDLMLGAEATLWTEQSDDSTIDARLWPRSAAMAERLWTDPDLSWKDVEDRFMIHRERLVNYKINADSLQPQWCNQHQHSCPLDGSKN